MRGRKGKGEDRTINIAADVALAHSHYKAMLPCALRASFNRLSSMTVPCAVFLMEARRGAFAADARVFSECSNIRYSFGTEGLPGNMGDDF